MSKPEPRKGSTQETELGMESQPTSYTSVLPPVPPAPPAPSSLSVAGNIKSDLSNKSPTAV